MNRHRAYYPMDEAPSKAGDTFFVGWDNRRAPAQLEPGMVTWAENTRMRYGKVQPRGGSIILRWMKGAGLTPWTDICGCGRFWDPATGIEHWLVAADGGVWDVMPNMPAVAVPIPAGVVLDCDTFSGFVQCFAGVLLLLGDDQPPVYMTSLVTGFEFQVGSYQGISGPHYTGHTDTTGNDFPVVGAMPPLRQGCYMGNRVWGVHEDDTVMCSDLFDPTSFFILHQFRINEGNGDRLVAVYPYDNNTLLCLKEHSVLRLENCVGDLSNVRLVPMTQKYGCVSALSIVDIGTDIYWMSERGVTSLRQTQQNELQGTSVTLSEPIEGTLARLNWAAREHICGETWGNYLQFAIPIDLSADNNAVLVYDLLNQHWVSLDTAALGSVTGVRQFQKVRINGQERLCATGIDGVLRLLEEGDVDMSLSAGNIVNQFITTRVVTRGYLANEWDRKQWKQVKVQIAHNNPIYSIGTVVEGAFETASHVASYQPTTGLSLLANGTNYDPTSTVATAAGSAGRHASPYREDYRVDATAAGFRVNSGVYPDQLQTTTLGYPIGERGHALQLDITNTSGRLEILAVECAGTEDERRLAARV